MTIFSLNSLMFLGPAFIGGIIMVMFMAPIGTVLIWRRQSFYADSLAHGAVLGVGLAQWLHIPDAAGVILSSILIGIISAFFQKRPYFTNDAILNVLSYSSLALGLILLKALGQMTHRVDALLFGDLLLLRWEDVVFLAIGGTSILIAFKILWKPLLQIAISPALAHVQGISVTLIDYSFRILIGIVIAIAFRYSGTLLLAALLIIPSLTTRPWVKSPEAMVKGAIVTGIMCVAGGVILSLLMDWPTTASIVIIAFLLFILTCLLKR